ncbi:TetR/AcrR family transcriptional regulator [Desulfobacterales bacterium HSG16]|nr:TetR/AcrR family transcriptional regulator [Desulfobacterales bacterium HSG16]
MSRPKAYKRDKVLDSATQLFWQKGYHGTSLSELVAATGLNKHSMYKEFGSKAGLFDECIAHYWRKIVRELLDILTEEPLGMANIRAFFKNRIEYICSEDFKSCLFVKTIIEKELVEAKALEQIRRRNKIYEKAFIACLEAAVRSGELPKKADPEFLTLYLLHFLLGLLVMGKPEKGKGEAEKLMKFIISSISKG